MFAQTYNYSLVLIAFIIATLASYTTLAIVARVHSVGSDATRLVWLLGGALVMGIGIWSMHFVGMLSMTLPIQTGFDVAQTTYSLVIAVLTSYFALMVAIRTELSLRRLISSGVVMGCGIAAMHYTGMHAMRMLPAIEYNNALVMASIVVAILASTIALRIAVTLQHEHLLNPIRKRIAAAGVMGLAIAGMHYTGMAAANFPLGSICCATTEISPGLMAGAVVSATLCIFLVTLVVSMFEGRLESNTTTHLNSLRLANNTLKEGQDKLQAIIDSSLDAVVQINTAGEVIGWCKQAERMFGWPLADAIGQPLHLMIIPEQYRASHVKGMQIYLAGGAGPVLNQRIEIEALHRDGTIFPIELSIAPVYVEGKREFTSFIRNITERRKAADALQLAAMVYEHSSEGMIVNDADGVILSVNPAYTRITGLDAADLIGTTLISFVTGAGFADSTGTAHGGIGSTRQIETWKVRQNGEGYFEHAISNVIYKDNKVYRYVTLISDITKKKASEEVIWRQANFDMLTGLPNRYMFHASLERELKKSERSGKATALLLLDLDFFKDINDFHGHAHGDRLLIEVSERIAACVRNTDTVARLGGDEFVVILADLDDVHCVESTARKIIEAISQPFMVDMESAVISVSIGISFYPNDARTAEDLIKHADQAMYLSKDCGRSRFSYFTASMQEGLNQQNSLARELRNALALNQFALHYQPIVDMHSGRIVKAEALLRWTHPELGMVSPIEFIPLAEKLGTIIEIGGWVFCQAVADLQRFRDCYTLDFQISINVSPVQLRAAYRDERFSWVDHLRTLDMPGQCIILEITEGLFLNAETAIVEKLQEFRRAGMQMALDDFGTGYSSLSYLKKFDFDYLKIDRTFVRSLAVDHVDEALCEAIIVMAHRLGLEVVAEGVETIQQRDVLLNYGCDFAQGYLYSRPTGRDAFEKLLLEQISHILSAPAQDEFDWRFAAAATGC